MKLFLAILAIVPLSVGQAATILSENFDELPAQLGVSTTVGQFTVTSGNVDVVGPGNGFQWLCVGAESGNCIDMTGDTAGTLQSGPITLQAGMSYFLSFDLIGSGRGDMTSTTVTLGNYTQTFVLQSWDTTSAEIQELITVPQTTVTNLVFQSNTNGVDGTLLDNVLLTSAAGAVPEPGSIFLLALGLAALPMRRFLPVIGRL